MQQLLHIEGAAQNTPMINEDLRTELIAMRSEDARVRQELMYSGQLRGPYVPCMEEVHKRNAARLRELIELHGCPVSSWREKKGLKRHGSSLSTQSGSRISREEPCFGCGHALLSTTLRHGMRPI
jgi:hypothetical protein